MTTHMDYVDASLGSRTADTKFTVGTITLPSGGQKTVKAIVISAVDDPGVSAASKNCNLVIECTSSGQGFENPQKILGGGFVSAPAATNPAMGYQVKPTIIPVEWNLDGTSAIVIEATSVDEVPTGGSLAVGLIFE